MFSGSTQACTQLAGRWTRSRRHEARRFCKRVVKVSHAFHLPSVTRTVSNKKSITFNDPSVGWSDVPRIKYIMFLPNTPLLLLATLVRGVNTLLGRADAVMATARGALPRKSITSSVPVLIPCCFAMSRKPDFQPAAQRQLGGLRTILRSLHPQTCAGSDIP